MLPTGREKAFVNLPELPNLPLSLGAIQLAQHAAPIVQPSGSPHSGTFKRGPCSIPMQRSQPQFDFVRRLHYTVAVVPHFS